MIAAKHNGKVLSSSCAAHLTIGDSTIRVDGDNVGLGNLTVTGSAPGTVQTYNLTDDEFCHGFWNDHFAEIECNIPWDDAEALNASSSERRELRQPEDMNSCFKSANESEHLPLLITHSTPTSTVKEAA